MTDPLDAGDDDLTIAAGPELDALMAELSQSRRDRTGEEDDGDDDLTVFGDAADETSHSLEPEPDDAPDDADDDNDAHDDDDDGGDEDDDDDDATVFGDLGQALTSGAVASGAVASGAVISDPAESGLAVSDDGDVSDERSDQTDQPPDAPPDLSSEPVAEKPSPPRAISFETSTPPPPGAPEQGPSASAPAPAPPPAPVAPVSNVPSPAPASSPAMSAPPAVSDSAQPWVPPASFPSPRREPPTVDVASGRGAARIGRVLAMGLAVVAVAAAGWVLLNRDSAVENQVDPAVPTPAVVESSE